MGLARGLSPHKKGVAVPRHSSGIDEVNGRRKPKAIALAVMLGFAMGGCADEAGTDAPRLYLQHLCSLLVSLSVSVESVTEAVSTRFDATASEEERIQLLLSEATDLDDALSDFEADLEDFEDAPPSEVSWYASARIHELVRHARDQLTQAQEVLGDPSIDARSSMSRGGELTGEALGTMLGMFQFLNSVSAVTPYEGEAVACPPGVGAS